MEEWHHFEWNHPRVLDFSCVVTLFPSNGKAEINAIETAAHGSITILHSIDLLHSLTHGSTWSRSKFYEGLFSSIMNLLWGDSLQTWTFGQYWLFRDFSSHTKMIHPVWNSKGLTLFCCVFIAGRLERLETGVKTRKRRLLIYWKDKVLAPVQRKLNKHLSFLT